MNTLDFVKKLISIPSFVDGETDEIKIGEFIYRYLQQFPWLTVVKQQVKNGRFNIIAKDNFPTRLLLNGHIDTVQPKSGWITNQYEATIKNGKLYGLGAADMKGNVTAMISSLNSFKQTKGLMLLFYIDEEYDFLGTKRFIDEYKNKITPELIISGDGNDMKIGNGCRGLIEITCITKGLSGHASQPQLGKNAILRSVKSINAFTRYIAKNYETEDLGKSSCNLAFLQGGLNLGRIDNQLFIGREGNNIADIAEFVLDIRTGSEKLDAKTAIKILRKIVEKNGLVLENATIRHDAKPWITPKRQIKSFEQIVGVSSYINPGNTGYIDMQMVWEAFNKTPTLTFGAGCGKTCHQANEYIRVRDLDKLANIYSKCIKRFAGGITKSL